MWLLLTISFDYFFTFKQLVQYSGLVGEKKLAKLSFWNSGFI
jgi:hypothetical protein